jgi:Zn-dependent peptidase ImmA (M78 family)
MKKQYEGVVSFITEEAKIWRERLKLSHWDIEHVFLDCYFEDESNDDFKISAITEARHQYYQAKIKWYLPSIARHGEKELRKTLVHELCHVLLSPEQSLVDAKFHRDTSVTSYQNHEADALQDRNYELLEMSTENVTRAILSVYGE